MRKKKGLQLCRKYSCVIGPPITVLNIIPDVYSVRLVLHFAHRKHSHAYIIKVFISIQIRIDQSTTIIPKHHLLSKTHPGNRPIPSFLCSIDDFINTTPIVLHECTRKLSTFMLSTFSFEVSEQVFYGGDCLWLSTQFTRCNTHGNNITCSWNVCPEGRPSGAPRCAASAPFSEVSHHSTTVHLGHFHQLLSAFQVKFVFLHLLNMKSLEFENCCTRCFTNKTVSCSILSFQLWPFFH